MPTFNVREIFLTYTHDPRNNDYNKNAILLSEFYFQFI